MHARKLVTVAALAFAASAQAAPPGSRWDRDYFGNAELVTQDGRKVRFYDDLLRGKIVVVDFIYTHCTKQCGVMSASLARVQRVLADRMGKDVFFYSITLDPERDTPEVLKEYAKAFRAGPGWTFLTGGKEDIAAIRKKFGDLTSVEGHASVLNIGNEATGQWMTKGALNAPQYLAMVIGDWMDPSWGARAGQPSAQTVTPAPSPALKGALLFNYKCAVCHAEDGNGVGPSLAGVTQRRDRAWLSSWIRAPEKVLAAGDPYANELVGRFKGEVMPNLDLSAQDVAALVDHLEQLAEIRRSVPAGL